MSFLDQCVLVNFPYIFFFLCLVAFKAGRGVGGELQAHWRLVWT